MKRLIALILGAAMCMALAACGDDSDKVVTVSDLQETATVERGEEITLTATASDGSAITWSSSDPQIATVDNGKVTAVYPGQCNIIATAESGARAQCALTVTYENQPEGWYEIEFYEQNKVPQGKWGYWNDQNWTGSQVTLTSKPEYLGDSEDSQAGSATFSYTATGKSVYGMQIVYRNAEICQKDKYYTLNCVIDVDVACVITVNGSRVELEAGQNDVSVDFLCDDDGHIYDQGDYTNLSSAVFIQMGSAEDDTMVTAATITISQLSWTEFTPEALAAPSLAIAGDKTLTITDSANNHEDVASYKIGLFQGDTLVFSTTAASGEKLNDSRVEDGTYTAKVKAIPANMSKADSAWSDSGVSYTVANGGVRYDVAYGDENSAVADENTWYFWAASYAEGSESNPAAAYENGTLTISVPNNSGEWYATQLFFKNSSLTQGQQYQLTMKINSDTAGSITVNGQKVTLVQGDNDVSVTVTEEAKPSVSIQLGVNGEGISMPTCTLGISDVAWEALLP